MKSPCQYFELVIGNKGIYKPHQIIGFNEWYKCIGGLLVKTHRVHGRLSHAGGPVTSLCSLKKAYILQSSLNFVTHY